MRKLRLDPFSCFLPPNSSTRWWCYGLALVFTLVGLSSMSHAQTKKGPVVTTDSVTTADGWNIPITYFQSKMGKEAAVVLLLHGEGENQLVWQKNGLAKRLQAENFAVITCDLRKHGQAKNARDNEDKTLNAKDFKAMASASPYSELEVIQDFLFKEHQAGRLNMAKYAIVAADSMAAVALNWAANDWTKKPFDDAPVLAAKTPRGQTVRGLILLSPTENVSGVSSAPPLRFFRMLRGNPVAMLFMHGKNDGRDVRNMVKQVTSPSNKKVIYSESFPTPLKGTDLIRNVPKAEPLTVGLLKKHVQDLDVEWKDRRSRAER